MHYFYIIHSSLELELKLRNLSTKVFITAGKPLENALRIFKNPNLRAGARAAAALGPARTNTTKERVGRGRERAAWRVAGRIRVAPGLVAGTT